MRRVAKFGVGLLAITLCVLAVGSIGSRLARADLMSASQSNVLSARQSLGVARFDGRAAEAPTTPITATMGFRAYLPIVYTPAISYRLGFGAAGGSPDRYSEISSLKTGWYYDWSVRVNPARPNRMEFVQTIRVHQKLTCPLYSSNAHDRTTCPYAAPYDYVFSPDYATLVAAARANPGSLWFIGNEMDRRDWEGGGQDEMLPELYAVAYHDLYHFVKGVDASAQVAIGGVIQATPLRLQYLTKVWDAYQQRYGTAMPVDIWNVHNFILKEKNDDYGAGIPPGSSAQQGMVYSSDRTHVDMALFDQQIRAFRAWMKARGQQDKPLIVSEYGVLYWHEGLEDPNIVQNFMIQTFDYFLNTRDCTLGYPADGCRLVQRWAWYSLADTGTTSGFNRYGALFDPVTRSITGTGERFRAYSLANLLKLAK